MPRTTGTANSPSSSTSPTAHGPDSVAALERGFRVLDCFASARRPLGNGEVSQLTGIPKPSVTRLVATLVTLGHLRPASQPDRWELAAGVVHLAEAFLGALDIRSFARPHVVKLAEEVGASSFLGIRDGLEMLVVEAARARSAVAFMGADVGTRMSLATSALGRAWLAGVDAPTRSAVRAQLARSSPALARAALSSMDHALTEARERGYCISLGEWHPNINAVAVPVRTPGGEIISLNCGSPAFVLPSERLEKVVVPRILAAAQALARDIGGIAGPELTRLAAGGAEPDAGRHATTQTRPQPRDHARPHRPEIHTESTRGKSRSRRSGNPSTTE